jgi:hypothetical protein
MTIAAFSLFFLLFLTIIFSQFLFVLIPIQFAFLSILAIYNSKIFILTYIPFLLTYKFFIPLFNINDFYELLPVGVNCFLLFVIFLTKEDITMNGKSIFRKVLIAISYILVTLLFGSFISGSPLFEILRWFLWIASPLLLAFYVYFSDIDHKEIFNIIINILSLFLIIQIPFVFLQSIPGSFLNWGPNADFYTGTFGNGGTAFLSFLSATVFYSYFIKAINGRSKTPLFFIFCLMIFFSIYADISFTIYVCFLSPLFFLLLRSYLKIQISQKRIIQILFLFLIVFTAFIVPRISSITSLLENQNVTSFNLNRFNFSDANEYSSMIWFGEDGGLRFGRSLGISYSLYTVIQSDFSKMIFGYGAGSTRAEDSVTGFSASTAFRPVPHTNFFGIDIVALEFGLIGVLAFFNLFYILSFKFLAKSERLNEEMTIYLAFLFLYFTYGLLYDGGWFFNSTKNGIFWILSSCCFYTIDYHKIK